MQNANNTRLQGAEMEAYIAKRFPKPQDYRRMLTVDGDAKTSKSIALGYLTGILYLSPADEAGIGYTTCPMSTPECRDLCLVKSGRMPMNVRSRIEKTRLMAANYAAFEASLRWDIEHLIRTAERLGLTPCVRINGTSDLPKIARKMASLYPTVQFYDYTKLDRPWQRTMANYSITLSHAEGYLGRTLDALRRGQNVAVVFDTTKGEELPKVWFGRQVVDGDAHDLRFLDPTGPKGYVIGLRAKGVARKATSAGFIQITGLPTAALATAA